MYPNDELWRKLRAEQAQAAAQYPFEPGHFYLGFAYDKKGREIEVGVASKRHALTIAGARSGKGVGVIIPNLLRWPHNAIVIDPKGEAAEATAAKREAMGQAVHVLDPFHVADVPDRFRARFNPLQNLDPVGRTIREDINVITDGLVMRFDPRAAHWDGGAASLIAGIIAHVVDTAPAELRTLPELRKLLTLSGDDFQNLIQEMATNGAVGNLPASAAARLLRSGTEASHFISGADENTKWLDSTPIAEVLTDSTFDLADLKTKPTTVYLVLPAHLINEHGRFLRLFVRSAIDAMAKGGTKGGHQTLFMLDEFFSLGRIDEIAKSSGLMPGYGVRLWPILQDLNQLTSLYGQEAGTFFANADVHQFFGNADKETLDYISHRIGATSLDEIPLPPGAPLHANTNIGGTIAALTSSSRQMRSTGVAIGGIMGAIGSIADGAAQAAYQDEMNEYHRQMSRLGKPRIAPDEVAALVQLKSDVVADGAMTFIYGSEAFYLHLAPYFRPLSKPRASGETVGMTTLAKSLLWGMGAALIAFLWEAFRTFQISGADYAWDIYSPGAWLLTFRALNAVYFGIGCAVAAFVIFKLGERWPTPQRTPLSQVIFNTLAWGLAAFVGVIAHNMISQWGMFGREAPWIEYPVRYFSDAPARGLLTGTFAAVAAFLISAGMAFRKSG